MEPLRQMTGMLNQFSALSTYVIVAAFAVHLFVFFTLTLWARRDLKNMASALYDFTRGLRHQSLLDRAAPLSDQVDAFLADVNDVISDPARVADRRSLHIRMQIMDERRRYLNSMTFETVYNMARTMIEAYPLGGIVGTVLAIGAALNADAGGVASVDAIVKRFGESIWCTFAGLVATIILLFINSFLEPGFNRLAENRQHVRETVARAKRELSLHAPQAGDEEAAT
ncbi:MotA/TolQ/ExbB proton channel family protein [Caulifigura coniformis]|uniref:MotA/TolQ/ExbB proton channel family protein n=1 Tax=Caulifigura coniformis TaxID=2527983 RepID=A0A517SE31_9PLAN|nr:MotA/TolQ/ExbB proton channel family protein [Caulifigura coniformis]QDT54385.1 MotA/TolQ/ExbB proton channel family protein [Caulifigura coniformis]